MKKLMLILLVAALVFAGGAFAQDDSNRITLPGGTVSFAAPAGDWDYSSGSGEGIGQLTLGGLEWTGSPFDTTYESGQAIIIIVALDALGSLESQAGSTEPVDIYDYFASLVEIAGRETITLNNGTEAYFGSGGSGTPDFMTVITFFSIAPARNVGIVAYAHPDTAEVATDALLSIANSLEYGEVSVDPSSAIVITAENLSNLIPIVEYGSSEGAYSNEALSPDGSRYTIQVDGVLTVYNTADQSEVYRTETSGYRDAIFRDNNTLGYTNDGSGTIWVDLSTGEEIGSTSRTIDAIIPGTSIGISEFRDEDNFLVVEFFDLDSGERLGGYSPADFGIERYNSAFPSFSTTGEFFVVFAVETLNVYAGDDLSLSNPIARVPNPFFGTTSERVTDWAISPDGSIVYACALDYGIETGLVYALDVATGETIFRYDTREDDYPDEMTLSPDGSLLFFSDGYDAIILDTQTASPLRSIRMDVAVEELHLSADGSRLMLASDGAVLYGVASAD